MFKIILIFYIICFALYVFFTRHPEYEDGEFTSGIIHYVNKTAKAVYIINETTYTINAAYLLRHLKENEQVIIIYDTSNPSSATVYTWWGYWLQWDELLASILIPIILLYAAKAITGNPTPEALIEDIEMDKPVKRRKYD